MGSTVDSDTQSRRVHILLRTASLLFALFWVGVILGKLSITYRISLPLIPEIVLMALLEAAILLALGVCLIKEQQKAQSNAPAASLTPPENNHEK